MKKWRFFVGILFVAVFVLGCAAKQKKTPSEGPESSSKIVQEDIREESEKKESPAPKTDDARPRVKVTARRLNLREKASVKSNVLQVLQKDDVLDVLSRKGGWLRVQNNAGLTGWVSIRYVQFLGKKRMKPSEDVKKAKGAAAPSPPDRKGTGGKSVPLTAKIDDTAAKKDFARGFFEVDGQKVPLKYAYLETRKDPFDKTQRVFRVFLTDRRVPVNDWHSRIMELASQGKLQYLELTLNQGRHISGVALETPLLKSGYVSSAGGHRFEAKTFGPSILEGTAFTKTREFQGQKYRYRVTFRATLMQGPGKERTKPPQDSKAPYDRSLFDTPVNQAIEKMLLASGHEELLRTTTRIVNNLLKDFGRATITYVKNGKKARLKVYLFKEKGKWTAYEKIPTHLDHPGIFFIMARQHCARKWRHFKGIRFLDDTWKTKEAKKRTIHFQCMELENNQWKYHPMAITYEFDAKKGWRITRALDLETAKQSAKQSETKAPPPQKEKAFSAEAVDRFFLDIMKGDRAAVTAFLDAGMSPNVKRPRLGHSPLLAAIIAKQEAIALMLIQRGADVNFRDANQATPLMWAARNCKSVRVVKALIQAGARVNARAKGGDTPLLSSKASRCNKITKILKKAGAR